MNKVVLDTNIVNYLIKGENIWKNYNELLNKNNVSNYEDWVLSFATITELFLWIIKDRSIESSIISLIELCPMAPTNISLCRKTAELANRISRERYKSKWHDIWIASTAIEYRFPLVTNNYEDFKIFEDYGLVIWNI